MKNLFLLLKLDFLAEYKMLLYWCFIAFLSSALNKFGIIDGGLKFSPVLLLVMEGPYNLKPELSSFINIPIKRYHALIFRIVSIIFRAIILTIVDALSRLWISPAHLEEYVKFLPLQSYLIVAFILTIYLFKELYIYLKLNNKVLKVFTAGLIPASPAFVLILLKLLDINDKIFLYIVLSSYLVLGYYFVFKLFSKRKEYLTFSYKIFNTTRYQSVRGR